MKKKAANMWDRKVREFKPEGMLLGSFAQLHALGCIQTMADVHLDLEKARKVGDQRFQHLRMLTNGNLCNGCPALKGGDCKAYQTYHEQPIKERRKREERIKKATGPTMGFGNFTYATAQLAKALGISKKQVRRLKFENKIEITHNGPRIIE